MAMRINDLTPEQEALLPVVRDEWLRVGLAMGLGSRAEAKEGVRDAYRAAGLEPPKFIIWLRSPWEGVIGQAIAPEIVAHAMNHHQVGTQVDAQVDAQVNAQVRGQVDAQVRGQVYDQVFRQVDAQVYDQVDAQVRGQVYAQVYAQVNAQVYGQVGGQVDAQVGGQVDAQVGGQVDAQVYAQVRGQVRGQVGDQVYAQVNDQVYGQRISRWYLGRISGCYSAGWYSYLDTMKRIGVTGLEPIHGQMQVARNAGWWWAFRDFAIITERPEVLLRDPQGRLHCEDGPAMRWSDGYSLYAWHGTRVEAKVIESDPSRWTSQDILSEPNSEVRRVMIERLGWDLFVEMANLQLVDSQPDPANAPHTIDLYDIPDQIYNKPVRVILVTNGSPERDGIRRRFGLTVDAGFDDAIEAAASTYRIDKATYCKLQRRT